MRRYCVENCGRETGGYSKTGAKNPYWCPQCDEVRIERIGKQLDVLIQDFPENLARAQYPPAEEGTP